MGAGAKFAWALVALVTILHFDLWNWDTTEVVFGFMPVGLAWQAGISLAAAAAWALMMVVGWPENVEAWAAQPSEIVGADEAPAGTGKDGSMAAGDGGARP